jgi:hypothetical protein
LGLDALNKLAGWCCALAIGMWAPPARSDAGDPIAHRVEARSTDLLAVGMAEGDRMSIHLSRLIDNAPVRDAAVSVRLRGVLHPTVAQADGSYTLHAPELTLPGTAQVQFQVTEGGGKETLDGALQGSEVSRVPEEKNSARQLGWWVLNFAVCIGFLLLWSRRRKSAAND